MLAPADLTLGLYTKCQGPGCTVERIVDCDSVSEALQVLERTGWTHQHSRVLCPFCTLAQAAWAREWSGIVLEADPQPDVDLPDLTMYVVTCMECGAESKYMCERPREAETHFADTGWSVLRGHVRCPEHLSH